MDPNRLKAIPLFSHLSDEEANRLAAFATETSAAEGQILMKQGDYADRADRDRGGHRRHHPGRQEDRVARSRAT